MFHRFVVLRKFVVTSLLAVLWSVAPWSVAQSQTAPITQDKATHRSTNIPSGNRPNLIKKADKKEDKQSPSANAVCLKLDCAPAKPDAKSDDAKSNEFDSQMQQGGTEARDGHYTEAAAHFSEAMKLAKSRELYLQAEWGYLSAHRVMSRWWWQFGAYFPPLRWIILHPLRVYFLILLGILLALAHKFGQGKGILYYFGRVFQRAFRPRFTGQAYIVSPVKLTDSAEASLFAGTLQLKFKEVLDRLRRDGESLQVNSVPYLSLPVELSNSVLKDAPEVKGFDLGKILQFVMGLSRYFRWRVESQIAFVPSVVAGGEEGKSKATVPGVARVSAALFWGWFPYPLHSVELPVESAYDLEAISYAVAARILGRTNDDFRSDQGRSLSPSALAKGLFFSDEEGFGTFMEGLACLQKFEDETLREVAHLQPLYECLSDAEAAFRRGLNASPFDPLPRYYLAIVLAIENQEVYLDYLFRLQEQFESKGEWRTLEFVSRSDRFVFREFSQRIKDLGPAVARLNDLWRERWDLLRSSVKILRRLIDDLGCSHAQPNPRLADAPKSLLKILQSATVFNFAQMQARLYHPGPAVEWRKSEALTVLNAMPELSEQEMQDELQGIREGGEIASSLVSKIALPFKAEILRLSLEARDFHSHKFRGALQDFHDLERKINELSKSKLENPNSTRFLQQMCNDLLADFLTKKGYMAMERALDCPLEIAQKSPDEELTSAEEALECAIELTPGRTSAKMYLAVVYRARAGCLTALAEIDKSTLEGKVPMGNEPDAREKIEHQLRVNKGRIAERKFKSERLFDQLRGNGDNSEFQLVIRKSESEAAPQQDDNVGREV